MILIDTSAWVEFLRNTASPTCIRVDVLLGTDIATCHPIRMEVLAGARDDERRAVAAEPGVLLALLDQERAAGEVEVEVVLHLDGEAGPCEARLWLWVIRKKFYRLAMWAWPTALSRNSPVSGFRCSSSEGSSSMSLWMAAAALSSAPPLAWMA